MYWATDSQQPPPASEERIPIIVRRHSSGQVEVLGWCSRARPALKSTPTSSSSSSRPPPPPPNLPQSPVTSDDGDRGESADSSRRNLSLPWTNHRLMPGYPVLASPCWSTTSSSSSSSASSVNSDFGTFGPSNRAHDDHPGNADSDDSDNGDDEDPLLPPSENEDPVSWLSLPHKSQLIVLALCRLSEPLTQTSVSAYLYYFLSSFHPPGSPGPSDGTISRQAGILASSFALAQCLTGVFWGRLSDRIGRKPCILLGLAGTTVSVIGFGFSESLGAALAFRIMGGCLNGNVGVLRTMVSEVIVEKKHQSRAFLIMPMCFNIGIIIGPMLGGLLADPVVGWPSVFGGIGWMERWKYALPNLASAALLVGSWVAGFLFLKETLDSKKHKYDMGVELRRSITRRIKQLYSSLHGSLKGKQPARAPSDPKDDYEPTGAHSVASTLIADDEETALRISFSKPIKTALPVNKPPALREVLTPNIITILISFTILPLHNTTFMHLWSIFLSIPRALPSPHSPFAFTGGLGLHPHQVGLAMSYLGVLGILLQLFCYPPLQARLGLLRSFRFSLFLFPLAYILTPLLTRLPASSPVMWIGIGFVLLLQVSARTFALPSSVILLTNSVERRAVLATVHGCATSLASASRTVGPAGAGALFAVGLENGVAGSVFWGMAAVAVVGAWSAWFVEEGKGISWEREREEREEEERLLPSGRAV